MRGNPLRILVIIHNQYGTGNYEKAKEMCQALHSIGHSVTLLCTSPNKHLFGAKLHVEGGVRIFEAPDLLFGRLRQGIDAWNALRRTLWALKQDFDVIHAVDTRPAVILPALLIRKIRNIPLVISWWDQFGRGGVALERYGRFYDLTLGRIETFFEEYFRKYADRASTISHTLKRRLVALSYPESKIEVVKVGCDTEKYKPLDKIAARKKLGLDANTQILCYSGKLFKRDLALLVSSLEKVKKRQRLPTTILIGKHSVSHEISSRLNIITTGLLKTYDSVHEYLCASDFGLVPMKASEANMSRWPSKISDYLAAGLPIVATPISDLPQVFEQRRIGYLSADDSINSFSKALCDALDTDLSLYRRLSVEARTFAEEELDWRVIAKRLEKLYMQAL